MAAGCLSETNSLDLRWNLKGINLESGCSLDCRVCKAVLQDDGRLRWQGRDKKEVERRRGGGERDRGRKWWSVEEADLRVLADEELSRLSECGGGKVRE